MRCAWKELLAILPQQFRGEVDKVGKENAQELRFRQDQPVEVVTGCGPRWLSEVVKQEDLRHIVNTASRYSPWAVNTVANGYITAPGGHRIGMCGEVYGEKGEIRGVRNVTSLNIRIARDYSGLIPEDPGGNILILGPPGSGKTTLLRDLCRTIAKKHTVTVVDERGELFPAGYAVGKRMDILTGCTKADGIWMALRTMGPECIALDEITQEEDCWALNGALWCGVRYVATAHAANREDLWKRPVYRPLMESALFDRLLILKPDKSWQIHKIGGAQ